MLRRALFLMAHLAEYFWGTARPPFAEDKILKFLLGQEVDCDHSHTSLFAERYLPNRSSLVENRSARYAKFGRAVGRRSDVE